MRVFYRAFAMVLIAVFLLSGCFWGGIQDESRSLGSEPIHEKDVPAALQKFYNQTPQWTQCKNGLECAEVTVPIDYSDPDGQTIEIAIARQRVKADTVGFIFFNPGGPGSEVVDLFTKGFIHASAKLMKKYSMVAVDPRGIGRSSKIKCYGDRDKDKLLFGKRKYPYDSPEYKHEVDQEWIAFGKSCKNNTGKLLDFVDTVSAAKDLDVIRSVIGSAKLNYLGVSYGTYLGGIYATLFPKKVGRMVLDSPWPNDQPIETMGAQQIEGFERSLDAFIDNCLSSQMCPFRGKRESFKKLLIDTAKRLNSKPMSVGNGLVLNGENFLKAIIVPLYAKESWPALSLALAEFFSKNSARLLFMFVGRLNGRRSDGTYDNSLEGFAAITCLDKNTEVKGHVPTVGEMQKVAPVFYLAYDPDYMSCDKWPAKPTKPMLRLDAHNVDKPILVLAATGDNATPYQWARRFVNYLGKAHLLTRHGQGHGSYKFGSKCIDKAVDTFFLDGHIPNITDCQQDPSDNT